MQRQAGKPRQRPAVLQRVKRQRPGRTRQPRRLVAQRAKRQPSGQTHQPRVVINPTSGSGASGEQPQSNRRGETNPSPATEN